MWSVICIFFILPTNNDKEQKHKIISKKFVR